MRREIVELRGRVQGVGFRYTVAGIARRHPVSGTVCNMPSGSVRIDVEGEPGAVEGFIDEVVRNPPHHARVDDVIRSEAAPRGVTGFRVSRD